MGRLYENDYRNQDLTINFNKIMSTTKCGAVPMEKGIMIRDLREEHKQ